MRAPRAHELTLVLCSMTLTELLCGNMRLPAFANPAGLALLVVAYGFPALAVRDLAVRWRLGLPGLYLLGLAYGLYNEGLVAKTLLLASGVPDRTFDGYGVAAGVNWSWAAQVTAWHSLHAMLFPVALCSALYPRVRGEAWLRPRTHATFLAASLLLALASFSKKPEPPASWPHFAAFLGAIGVLVGLAYLLRGRVPIDHAAVPEPWKPLVAGAAAHLLFFLPLIVLASKKAPGPLYAAVAVALPLLLLRTLVGRGWASLPALAYWGLGSYFLMGSLRLAGALGADAPWEPLVVVAAAFLWLGRTVARVRAAELG